MYQIRQIINGNHRNRRAVKVHARKLFAIVQAEIVNQSFFIAPVFLDLYPALQIDLDVEKALQIFSGKSGNAAQHGAVFADKDALVGFPFAVDCGINVQQVFVIPFLHPFDGNGDSVGNFIPEQIQDFFPDHLGRQNPFRLVSEFFIREKVRCRLC